MNGESVSNVTAVAQAERKTAMPYFGYRSPNTPCEAKDDAFRQSAIAKHDLLHCWLVMTETSCITAALMETTWT